MIKFDIFTKSLFIYRWDYIPSEMTIDEFDATKVAFNLGSWGHPHDPKLKTTTRSFRGTISMYSEDERVERHTEYIPMIGSRRKGYKRGDYTNAVKLYILEVSDTGKVLDNQRITVQVYTAPCGKIIRYVIDGNGDKIVLLKNQVAIIHTGIYQDYYSRKLNGRSIKIKATEFASYGVVSEYSASFAN